ncbi:MAG: ASCH domain-containing protein [Planctomycetes bacterium]|nr:ASCH domain-containing protein [Planctomycetota bacterium]
MRALSIRQPYAELILRGEKTIEYRSRPTKIIGERFYIYASRKWERTLTPTLSQRERE